MMITLSKQEKGAVKLCKILAFLRATASSIPTGDLTIKETAQWIAVLKWTDPNYLSTYMDLQLAIGLNQLDKKQENTISPSQS